MHLAAGDLSGNASWNDDLPDFDPEFSDVWLRRYYWQALLMASVGLSLLLGAFVFLVAMLSACASLRPNRCGPGAAGAAAATLSSLLLVVLLVSTRAVSVETPKYE